ncbi:hypothetical protein LTR95_004405 [Oleoguttula sp. CCFEE 5521]
MGQDLEPESVQMYDPYEDEDEFPEANRKPTIDPMEHAKNTTEVPLAFHDPQPIVDAKGNHPEAEWACALEPDIHESDSAITTPVPAIAKEDEKATQAGGGFFGGKLHMPHLRHPHLPGHHPHTRERHFANEQRGRELGAVPSDLDRGATGTASEIVVGREGFIGALRRRTSELAYCL